jgi:hypothetical protein
MSVDSDIELTQVTHRVSAPIRMDRNNLSCMDPDPDPGGKITNKNKKVKKFHVLMCWMFF